MSERRETIVVTVPAGSIKPDGFGKFRDYVLESLQRGGIVLDDTMRWSVEEMPVIDAVCIRTQTEVEEKTVPSEVPKVSVREEKQQILQRLLDYRQRNGAGSLGDVARKTNVKSITVDVLRLLVNGDATLSITEWRAIGRALGKLEEIEKEVAGNG